MSSYHRILSISVMPNEPRDYYRIVEASADTIIDLWNEQGVVGLDWHVWNTGSQPLTVMLDGTQTMTIVAGADRGFDNIKFAVIKVVATDSYTLAVAGVKRR